MVVTGHILSNGKKMLYRLRPKFVISGALSITCGTKHIVSIIKTMVGQSPLFSFSDVGIISRQKSHSNVQGPHSKLSCTHQTVSTVH